MQENEDENKPLLSDLVTPIVDVDFHTDFNAYYSHYDDDFPIPLSQNKISLDIDSGTSSRSDAVEATEDITFVTEDGKEFTER